MENMCPKCHTINDSRAKFCKKCGADIKSINVESKRNKHAIVFQKDITNNYLSYTSGKKNEYHEKNFQYSFLSMFMSIIITICFQKFVIASLNCNNFFHRILIPVGGWNQIIIPLTIIFLFFWSMIDLFVKFIRNLFIYKALNNKFIKQLPDIVNQNDKIDFIQKEIKKLAGRFKINFVFKRIQHLVLHIFTLGDIQRSHEFFKHQIDLDADNAQSGYTIIRIFIWAMPILGFIGTVIGISSAVGDFSGFLGGDIDQVDRVKMELSKITTGLSYAFDTTLLGLLSSLIAMVFTTLVQRKEEASLTSLETLGLNIIANTNYNIKAPQYDQNNQLLEFSDSINCFSKIIQDSTDQLCLIPDKLSSFIKQIDINTKELKEKIKVLLSVFDEFAKTSLVVIKLSNEIQKISESLSEMYHRLYVDLDQILKITNTLKDSEDHIEKINDNFKKFSSILPEFTDRLINLHVRMSKLLQNDENNILGYIEESVRRLKDILNCISNEESNDSIIYSVTRFQMLLDEQITSVSDSITSFNTSMNISREELAKELSMIPYDLQTNQLNMKDESTQLSQCIQTLTNNIENISQTSESFNESSQKLVNEFSQLFSVVKDSEKNIINKYSDFDELSEQFKRTFQDGTIKFVKSLDDFSQKVNELKSTQESTIKAVNSLESFKKLIQSMQITQKDLSQIVKELSGPLEFRLVPTQQQIIAEQTKINS